jgi:branched-subunit amino acid transport protein
MADWLNSEWLLIVGMFVVTFGTRFFLFAFAQKIAFPAWLSHALSFVPVAVLTAIIVPAIAMPKGELWVSAHNPWLVAGIASAIICMVFRHLLTTIVGGMLVFILLRFF